MQLSWRVENCDSEFNFGPSSGFYCTWNQSSHLSILMHTINKWLLYICTIHKFIPSYSFYLVVVRPWKIPNFRTLTSIRSNSLHSICHYWIEWKGSNIMEICSMPMNISDKSMAWILTEYGIVQYNIQLWSYCMVFFIDAIRFGSHRSSKL